MEISFKWHEDSRCWLYESTDETIKLFPVSPKYLWSKYYLWIEKKAKNLGVGYRCDSIWAAQKYLEPNRMIFRDPQEEKYVNRTAT